MEMVPRMEKREDPLWRLCELTEWRSQPWQSHDCPQRTSLRMLGRIQILYSVVRSITTVSLDTPFQWWDLCW